MDLNPSYADAISSIESGGQYGILGPITKSGDRAYGKYQVMGSNVGPWTKEILGKQLTPQQFVADPQAQDAVFQGKFGQYVSKFGNPQDAASAWFTGQPLAKGANRADLYGTTGASYVNKFNAALGQPQAQPQAQAQASASPMPPQQPPAQPQQFAQQQFTGFPSMGGSFGGMSNPQQQFNPTQMPQMPQMQRHPLNLSGLAQLLQGSPAIQRLISQG